MPTALVTGANRGLGLEHVRQFAERGWRVFAASRSGSEDADLAALTNANSAISRLDYDAADPDGPRAVSAALSSAPIDVLLNNAGMMGSEGGDQSFAAIEAANLIETFSVNAVAPLMLTRALVDNVAASERRIVAMQSSQMGSIADTSAGFYAYRAAKAALNMIAKAAAGDLAARNVTVITMHPGWVRTRMGGPGGKIDPDESVRGQQALFDRIGPADSGKFFRYDGVELPW
jgi:NAD(P)-dependent dehydrogenase (short-subunit alcohol dehydrogenase family)